MIIRKLTGFRLQVTGFRLQVTVILAALFILVALLVLQPTTYNLPTAYAADPCLNQTTNPRAGGLISAPEISSNKFSNATGNCVIDLKAAFVSYKIPTYADLKSLYFDQSKSAAKVESSGSIGEGSLSNYLQGASPKNLIHIMGFLSMNNNIAGSNTAVVFIDGDLYFYSPLTQFTYGNNSSGIVFVVGGNVYIDQTVRQIDAVVISAGNIYTASSGGGTCNTNSSPTNSQLLINGSLISIYRDKNQATSCTSASPPANCPVIKFCRSLADNNTAAEKIVHQPKYVVILRDLFADTLQRWSEIQ